MSETPSFEMPQVIQRRLVGAMIRGISQAPECMAFTTAQMGAVVLRGIQEGRLLTTADSLAHAELSPPHLTTLLDKTISEHTKLMENGLPAPPIPDKNLPGLLKMFYRFGIHGMLRTAALVAEQSAEPYTRLGDATPDEIARAEVYLAGRTNRTAFLDLLHLTSRAFSWQPVARVADGYRAALLGEPRPPAFDRPLTPQMRENRQQSLAHTQGVLQPTLVVGAQPLVEGFVTRHLDLQGPPPGRLTEGVVHAAISTLMIP